MDNTTNINVTINTPPAVKLKTNYSLLKIIFLSILTLGIYGIVQWVKMVNDVNTACTPHDGKKTTHYIVFAILSVITLGIYSLVWNHKIFSRVGQELSRRGIAYSIGAGTFWGWHICGILIGVGPIIATYSLIKAINLLNGDYNARG